MQQPLAKCDVHVSCFPILFSFRSARRYAICVITKTPSKRIALNKGTSANIRKNNDLFYIRHRVRPLFLPAET